MYNIFVCDFPHGNDLMCMLKHHMYERDCALKYTVCVLHFVSMNFAFLGQYLPKDGHHKVHCIFCA